MTSKAPKVCDPSALPLTPRSPSFEKKPKWGNQIEFSLAILGYSIGMGSLTRFPYLCMKNGGGAFLIPWIIAMIIGGIPLFYIELVLGQFSGKSPLTMWSFCPAFKGIGYASAILSGLVSIYYNMQIGWCVFYLVKSIDFSALDVPWRGCDRPWSSENCYDPFSADICVNNTDSIYCPVSNSTASMAGNRTDDATNFVLPSEDFWNNVILGTNGKGMEDIGDIRWQLALCLFSTWVIVFLCMMKGVQSLGKVVYVTATAPYFLLTALVIRGLTLEGSVSEGLVYYLKPNMTTLANHDVWIEASMAMFHSLGPAWGGIITMASHNKFHHNYPREAIWIPIADVFTALYSGVAVFSVAGFMARRSGKKMKEFALSGPGLSFIVFPQAIAEMPASPVWAILFFLTLLTMALDSQFGMVDTLICGILDFYPRLRRYKVAVTAIVSGCLFLAGLPLASQGGMFLYTLIDWYIGVITLATVAFLEIVVVAYVYGLNRFSEDISLMLGSPPNWFWKIVWLVAAPAFMALLLFYGIWNLKPPVYEDYEFPWWGIMIGWVIAFLSFIPIPGFAIYAFVTSPHKSLAKRIHGLFTPTDEWIPAKEELVDGYLEKRHFKSRKRVTLAMDEIEEYDNICQELRFNDS